MGSQAATSPIQSKTLGAVLWSVGIWCTIALLATVAVVMLRPPAPLPDAAPANEFSAERALPHLRAIAQSPHPIGSIANNTVREYLVAQLSALGLNPQTFPAIGVYRGYRNIVIGKTQDVIARLPGKASSAAIVLMAHYDSVSRAPGAADDGAGVAAILEVVRALQSGPSLKNDLIVAFTDGEEPGLLGADAFATGHTWMKDVGLILNFEARGDQGPSLLFETSPNNAALIDGVANSAPHPIGSSLFYAFYKLLPNDTDFSVFRLSGTPGLNFAFGAGLEAYHSALDTVHNLSLASLQHHGSYALNLARYFGQMDLKQLKHRGGDDVFFDWLGHYFIAYAESWILPAQVLVTLLLIFVVLLSLKRSELRMTRILLASFPLLAVIVSVPLILMAVWWLLARMLAGHLIFGDSSANAWLLTGITLLGIVTGGLIFAIFRRRFILQELSLAGLIVLCILSWVLALALPAGSYLLFWPLLFAMIGALLVAGLKKIGQANALGLSILPASALAILLFAPVAYLLYIFLTLQFITMLALGLLIGLFFLVCTPLMDMALPPSKWGLVLVILLVCSATFIGIGVTLSHYSPEHPRRDTVLYSLNADDHTAKWISYDPLPDDWTAHFIGAKFTKQPVPDYLGGLQRPVISGAASPIQLEPPIAEIRGNKKEGDFYKIQMNVRSPRNAGMLLLTFDNGVELSSVKIGERQIASRPNSTTTGVLLLGMSDKESDLELTLKARSGISFWLMDQSSGLPGDPPQRPSSMIAGDGSDVTVVCRKYAL